MEEVELEIAEPIPPHPLSGVIETRNAPIQILLDGRASSTTRTSRTHR